MKQHLKFGLIHWCIMLAMGFIIESSYVIIGAGLKGTNTVVLIVMKTGLKRAVFYGRI